VAVRNDNGTEMFGIEFALGRLYNTARPRVDQEFRTPEVEPDTAGGQELADYHKTCPTRP